MDEELARKIIGEKNIRENNAIHDPGWWASWSTGDDNIVLDGHFTAIELEALLWWMKNKDTGNNNAPGIYTVELSAEDTKGGHVVVDFTKAIEKEWADGTGI